MENVKQIDFLSEEEPQRAKKGFKKLIPSIFVFVVIFGIVFTTKAVLSGGNVAEQFGNASLFEQIKFLVSSDSKTINGEENGRINIMLLGIGGDNHEGGQLTDTIMVASIDTKLKKIGIMSIPRDLVAPIEGVGWQKINSANAFGIKMDPNRDESSGAELARGAVENITGLQIHYYFKVDFDGFKRIIDAVGGVEVDVPVAFSDYKYPDNNYGYKTINFEQGKNKFNGEKALEYARSRHGTNGEGSDFARARRQQLLIKAFQQKILSLSTLLNPNKLLSIAEVVSQSMKTDMQLWELAKLYEIGKECDLGNIKQVVLSAENGGLLVPYTNEEGAYLLRPQTGDGDFSQIQIAAKGLVEETPENSFATSNPNIENSQENKEMIETETDKSVQGQKIENENDYEKDLSIETPKAEQISEEEKTKDKEVKETKLRIAVQNGTAKNGLAARTATSLKSLSYTITQVANAKTQDYEKTVIYNLSGKNISEKDAQQLIKALGANISTIIPESIEKPDADLLIILGEDNV